MNIDNDIFVGGFKKVYKDEIVFTTDLFIMNKSLIKAIIYVNILEKYKLHIAISDDSWIFTSDNSLYKTITIYNDIKNNIIEIMDNEMLQMIYKIEEAIEKQEIFEILLKYYT